MILEKIQKVNALLESQGSKAVQKIEIGNRPVLYGYRPQFVFDAVNEVFGPEHWKYKVNEVELFCTGEDNRSGQVVASVEVFLKDSKEAEFISHGIQYGQTHIVSGNIGDARKGAVTDAIQKGLATSFSIGKKAYRGELGTVYNDNKVELSQVPDKQKPNVSSPALEEAGLPVLPNVSYEADDNGTILAMGDTYNNRSLLKSTGFRWMAKEKAWGFQQAV